MADLGTLGGTDSTAHAINSSGIVVGQSNTADDVTFHAFRYVPGVGMADLGTLGGSESTAYGINDAGQVVGGSYTTGDTAYHAFSHTSGGGMIDLGTLGGSESSASAVNINGLVVGGSYTAGDAAYHAFSYTPGGGMVDLNTYLAPGSGWELVYALAVNDNGQIVGKGSIDGKEHAFLMTPTLVPVPAAVWLFGSALAGLGVVSKRRSKGMPAS
jgi:probable HAF family extracellular repeat protein